MRGLPLGGEGPQNGMNTSFRWTASSSQGLSTNHERGSCGVFRKGSMRIMAFPERKGTIATNSMEILT